MNTNFIKVKGYLSELNYEIIAEDQTEEILVVRSEEAGIENLIIDCEDSIVLVELFLFEIKDKSVEALEDLLIKNRQIIHGAFCLDETGKKVIFRDTLQIENLDLNELEGTLNSLELMLSEFSSTILAYAK